MPDEEFNLDLSYFLSGQADKDLSATQQNPMNYGANAIGLSNQTEPAQVREQNQVQSVMPQQVPFSPLVQQQMPVSPYPQSIPTTFPCITNQINNFVAQQIKAMTKADREFNSDEAYSEVLKNSKGLYMLDKNQREHIVFPLEFKSCVLVEMDPIYSEPSFYRIDFEGGAEPLIISKKQFQKENQLANMLESHYKESIRLCGPKRKVFSGIRSFLTTNSDLHRQHFYAGWEKGEGSSEWTYSLQNGSTHSVRNLPMVEVKIPPQDSVLSEAQSVQLTASTQFAETMMSAVKDDSMRHMVTSILHLSALYSLLDGLNYRIPFGMCLSCGSRPSLEIIEALCSWFGDSSITLSETKERFANLLIERKDQPALVWDESAQISNSKLLEHAIKTGVIANGKDEYKLQALPVILSQQTTHLSQSPQMIRIPVPADAVQVKKHGVIENRKGYFKDYIRYFNRFMQNHQGELLKLLGNNLREIGQKYAQQDFPKDEIRMLGVLCTVDSITKQYYCSLSPNQAAEQQFAKLFAEDFHSLVLDSFEAQRRLDSNDKIAELFFRTANQMIKDDHFNIRAFIGSKAFEPCPLGKAGIIYIHNDDPCLSTEAYDRIVAEIGYKPSITKQALAAVSAFKGAKANEKSYQTRLGRYNPATGQGAIPVYRFSCEDIHLPEPHVTSVTDDLIKEEPESRIRLELGKSVDNSHMVWHGVDNCHVCVTGKSGSGKSYFLKKMIVQLPAQNTRCIIFDTSGEFSRAADGDAPESWVSAEANVIDMRNTNMQQLFFRKLTEEDTPTTVANRFANALSRRVKLGSKQRSSLVGCIEEALSKDEPLTFQSLLEQALEPRVCNEIKSLNGILPLGNQPFDWDFDIPGITVLNLHNGGDDDAKRTVLELLLSSICEQQMNVHKESYPSVVLVIDECQLLKWKQDSNAYNIMIRGRKFGLSMWLSTQTLSQIDNPAIPEQADLRVFFRPADAEIPRILRCLYLSDNAEKAQCKGALSTLSPGQYLCKLNNEIYISSPPVMEKTKK